jgi:hypothetical protein
LRRGEQRAIGALEAIAVIRRVAFFVVEVGQKCVVYAHTDPDMVSALWTAFPSNGVALAESFELLLSDTWMDACISVGRFSLLEIRLTRVAFGVIRRICGVSIGLDI